MRDEGMGGDLERVGSSLVKRKYVTSSFPIKPCSKVKRWARSSRLYCSEAKRPSFSSPSPKTPYKTAKSHLTPPKHRGHS